MYYVPQLNVYFQVIITGRTNTTVSTSTLNTRFTNQALMFDVSQRCYQVNCLCTDSDSGLSALNFTSIVSQPGHLIMSAQSRHAPAGTGQLELAWWLIEMMLYRCITKVRNTEMLHSVFFLLLPQASENKTCHSSSRETRSLLFIPLLFFVFFGLMCTET